MIFEGRCDFMSFYKAKLQAIEYYLPHQIQDNEYLVANMMLDWSPEDIFAKTGIARRHISQGDETAVDMGVIAAKKLFASGACKTEDIDFLLFCTQSPDYFLPASACIIHQKLGLKNDCGALDYNQGCSGFIYGLSMSKALIESGIAKNVLLITSETYSKYINPNDRSTRTIFGDGAAATLLSSIESEVAYVDSIVLGTNGAGSENLIVPAGGARLRLSDETSIEIKDHDGNFHSQENLYMNGPEIFNFTLKTVPKTIQDVLVKSQKGLDDIDYFVFHQANKFMLDYLRKKLKISERKFWIGMYECGNTVSASIPIALKMAREEGLISTDDRIMLVGFGVGYSWGGCLIRL